MFFIAIFQFLVENLRYLMYNKTVTYSRTHEVMSTLGNSLYADL